MVYRYVAIGDSLTVGTGALLGTGFVPIYRRMAEMNLRTFVSMDNLGVNGLTSGELQQMINGHPRVRQALREADIITVSIGGNDLIRTFKASGGIPSAGKMTQVLGETRHHVSQVMRQIRQLKAIKSILFVPLDCTTRIHNQPKLHTGYDSTILI